MRAKNIGIRAFGDQSILSNLDIIRTLVMSWFKMLQEFCKMVRNYAGILQKVCFPCRFSCKNQDFELFYH